MYKYIFKVIIFFAIILYQSSVYSKITNKNNFNQKYLSDYFSALISLQNQNNNDALKFFNSSKGLINNHSNFLKKYIYSLVLEGKVSKSINLLEGLDADKKDFFEAQLLIYLKNLKKKDFNKTSEKILNLKKYNQAGNYEYIIHDTLRSFNNLFLKSVFTESKKKYGNLSLINDAFQNCYLNNSKTNSYFENLINLNDGDYSRYLFFYLSNLIENQKFQYAVQLSDEVSYLNSSLLLSQSKQWINNREFHRFEQHFSCSNETDIVAEFFFLISNLYSSQKEFDKSNFYLNLSSYLNPNFYFNLSLLSENYFSTENYDLSKKILEVFDKKDQIYYWYKIKKIGQIINKQENDTASLEYIEKKFKNFKKPNKKILFDMASIYKNFKEYEKSIEIYSKLLLTVEQNSELYADILYRRGGSYERIGKHQKSDEDLIKSLEIVPEDPYVMNYLAYSWLERGFKVKEVIKMLDIAYKKKESDPYIIDSVAWGYYLTGDYYKAEKLILKALAIMPQDPVVNDHYGDILWKLNRKLQARYFWKNVLKLERIDEDLKKSVKEKLLRGNDKV